MNSKIIGSVILIIIILVIVWAVSSSKRERALDQNSASTTNTQTGTSSKTTKTQSLADGSYTLDTSASVINWKGSKKIVDVSHVGTLALKEGSVVVTNGALASGTFAIDMNSLKDDGSGVGKHLLSADFFDVTTYPTATFTLTKMLDGVVSGDLTIKGVTKPVTFPVSLEEKAATITAKGMVALDRTQWGIKYGSDQFFKDLGDKVIKDTIDISLVLVAKKS